MIRESVLLLLMGLLLIAPFGTTGLSQTSDSGWKWPCGEHQNLLRDKAKNPIWIPSDKAKKRATYLAPIKLLCCTNEDVLGTATVDVVINEKGRVVCAVARSGHALLQAAAVQAAFNSKFLPWKIKGKPVSVFAKLSFNYPESADDKEPTPDKPTERTRTLVVSRGRLCN
jgi:hypothetical protein